MASHGLRNRCFTTGRLRWDFWLICRSSGRRDYRPPFGAGGGYCDRLAWLEILRHGVFALRVAFLNCAADFFDERCRNWFRSAAGPDMLFSAALILAMASGAFVLSRRGALRSENDSRVSTAPLGSLRASLIRGVARACSTRKRPGGSCTRRRRDRNWAIATSRGAARCASLIPSQSSRSAWSRCRGTCFAPRAIPTSSTYLFFSTISSATSRSSSNIASRFGISSRFFCSDCFPGRPAFGQRSKKDCNFGDRSPGALRRDSFLHAGLFSRFCFSVFRNRNYPDISFRPFLRSAF